MSFLSTNLSELLSLGFLKSTDTLRVLNIDEQRLKEKQVPEKEKLTPIDCAERCNIPKSIVERAR